MRNRAGFERCLFGTVQVDHFGASGDGTGDQTSAINNAIEASNPGDSIIFTPGNTYQVNGTVILLENRTYIGYGSTIKLKSAATGMTQRSTNLNVPTTYYPVVMAEQGGSQKTNIVVLGLRIDGNGANQPDGKSYAGITTENTDGMILEDMYVYDCAQNLDINPATDRAFCFFVYKSINARLVNCKGDNAGYDTLSIRGVDATDNQVIGGMYTRGQKTTCQIFDDATRNLLQGVTLDNTNAPNPGGDGSSAGALFIHGASKNRILGCQLIGAVSSALIIMGDTVSGSAGATPRYANYNIISGCTIRFTAATGGSICEFSTAGSGYQYSIYNLLSDNYIEYTGGANRVPIACPTGVLENSIHDNIIVSNGNQPLITLDACNGLDIRGNTLLMTATGTTLALIRCDSTLDTSICDNRLLTDAVGMPFVSTTSCTNMQIHDNFCEHRSSAAASPTAAFLNSAANTNLSFIGNTVKSGNSTAMFYFAGVTTGCQVTGNKLRIGNNGAAPSFAIRFQDAQNSPGNIVTDNDFAAATTAFSTAQFDIRVGSVVANNRVSTAAQLTKNYGTGTVATGATTAVITHNLFPNWGNGRAVRKSDIRITPASDWLLSVKWWVSAISATTFTLTVSVAPGGAGFDFTWEGTVEQYDGA